MGIKNAHVWQAKDDGWDQSGRNGAFLIPVDPRDRRYTGTQSRSGRRTGDLHPGAYAFPRATGILHDSLGDR